MALAVLIALTTAAFVAAMTAGRWWLPLPISEAAVEYDGHLRLTLAVLGGAFVLVQVLLAVCLWRYRERRRAPASGPYSSWRLEAAWTAVTALVFFGLGWGGLRLGAVSPPEQRAPVRIEVLSQQFAWNFRYPGPDGQFGRTDPALVNDAVGNAFGLDPSDPNARDDRTAFVLKAPAGVPVELVLNSRDVIHSFFVRELRLKQDLIPGMRIPVRFTALRPGQYEIACAELCGLGHHQMRSVLEVLPLEEYQRWVAGEAGP